MLSRHLYVRFQAVEIAKVSSMAAREYQVTSKAIISRGADIYAAAGG